jgi:[protein-PII] uridylyltransferase
MLNTGMMVAFIPEMKGIVNRIQYDEYHVYPVDKHSLRTVQTLKALRDAMPKSPDAFYADIFRDLRKPILLLWAGLLHDVGKGGHGDGNHAGRGARIVRRLFEQTGFPDQESEAISRLVLDHIFLIDTATRRDINDEKTVAQCARNIRDIEHLKMLYLLTVADSRATGPKAWNDWKDALLKELFFKVRHILNKGELSTPAAFEVVEKKKQELFQGAVSMSREAREALFDHSTIWLLDQHHPGD